MERLGELAKGQTEKEKRVKEEIRVLERRIGKMEEPRETGRNAGGKMMKR